MVAFENVRPDSAARNSARDRKSLRRNSLLRMRVGRKMGSDPSRETGRTYEDDDSRFARGVRPHFPPNPQSEEAHPPLSFRCFYVSRSQSMKFTKIAISI